MTDITIDDIVFEDTPPPPTVTGRPKTSLCGECGKEFDVGPRGRVPANCPEHRKNKATGTGKGRGRGRRKVREAKEYARMAFEAISGFVVTPLVVAGVGIKHPGVGATGFVLGYQTAPRLMDEDTGTILQHGPIPDALGEIATQEPKLADVLERITEAGPWVKLAMALAPVLPQLVANTGFLGSGWLQTADPEALRGMAGAQLAELAGDSVIPFAKMVPQPEDDGVSSNGHR